MMCPIDNLVNRLRNEHACFKPHIETILKECKLKYRTGNNHLDIQRILEKKRQPSIVVGGLSHTTVSWYGKPKNLTEILDEIGEEMDKVVRIDWNAYYGKVIPSITFV